MLERNVAMGRGQFPNRIKSNQPYGRRLLTLNGTNPLPTAPDLFARNRACTAGALDCAKVFVSVCGWLVFGGTLGPCL